MRIREIKFRVFGSGYMSKPFQLRDLQIGNIQFASESEIMQFIGLLDKNGKEIYEGDIIKQGNNPECWFSPRVVEFKNGAWMGAGIRIYVEQDKGKYQGVVSNNEWEVIGNIYENPELLK